jgi:hypothetical protein
MNKKRDPLSGLTLRANLTQTELAAITKKHRQHINRMCKEGDLDTIILYGKKLVVLNQKCKDYITSCQNVWDKI